VMWWIGHLIGGLAGAVVIFAILLAAAGLVYHRSRRAPVGHHNVNAEWDPAAPQDEPRVPVRTAR
jgi:inorganic phosphate transporter, PiT family